MLCALAVGITSFFSTSYQHKTNKTLKKTYFNVTLMGHGSWPGIKTRREDIPVIATFPLLFCSLSGLME
jgi:hypothetical protein